MKKWYHLVLTLLTIAMLALVTFNKLNSFANWVDLSQYQELIANIWAYGPIVLVCLFAFGSLFGKIMSKILGVIIVLLLIVFTICMFAPDLIANIFASNASAFFGI